MSFLLGPLCYFLNLTAGGFYLFFYYYYCYRVRSAVSLLSLRKQLWRKWLDARGPHRLSLLPLLIASSVFVRFSTPPGVGRQINGFPESTVFDHFSFLLLGASFCSSVTLNSRMRGSLESNRRRFHRTM